MISRLSFPFVLLVALSFSVTRAHADSDPGDLAILQNQINYALDQLPTTNASGTKKAADKAVQLINDLRKSACLNDDLLSVLSADLTQLSNLSNNTMTAATKAGEASILRDDLRKFTSGSCWTKYFPAPDPTYVGQQTYFFTSISTPWDLLLYNAKPQVYADTIVIQDRKDSVYDDTRFYFGQIQVKYIDGRAFTIPASSVVGSKTKSFRIVNDDGIPEEGIIDSVKFVGGYEDPVDYDDSNKPIFKSKFLVYGAQQVPSADLILGPPDKVDGGGWKESFFGAYNDFLYPTVNHLKLGFMYLLNRDSNGGFYFYIYDLNRFFYANVASFPFVYDFSQNAWLYYFPSTTKPRVFYNTSTGETQFL